MKKCSKVMSLVLIILLMIFTLQMNTSYAQSKNKKTVTSDTTTKNTLNNGKISNDRGLVSHFEFEKNLLDSSQFGNDGTAIGKISYVDGIFGKGAKFDGNTYIEVLDSPSLVLTNAFTFSMWVYKEDMRVKSSDYMDVGVPYFVKMNGEYEEWPYAMFEWFEFSPGVRIGYEDEYKETFSDTLMDIQKWTLLTSTYDGKTMRIYLNDQLVKSELINVTITSSSEPLWIGFANFMNRDNYFKGIMDDFRIYDTALSYGEVEELYAAGLTGDGKNLLEKPNRLVGYYNFEENGYDASIMKNNAIAINSKGGITYIDGIAGKAAKFNGASYFEVQDSSSLDLDRFTICAWINEDKTSARNPILTKYGNSIDRKQGSYSIYDSYGNSGINLELGLFDEDDTYNEFETNIQVELGKWFYYSATYDGETVKIYNNGSLVNTVACDSTVAYSSGPMWLGAFMDGSFFKGSMDQLRIYNYALTPSEIKELYGYADYLSSAPTDKFIKLSSLIKGKTVQLKSMFHAYSFIAQTSELPNGKDGYTSTDISAKAAYSSSNTKVVTVTAIGKGSAKVTVTYRGKSAVLNITVV